jgi:OMF family outer membrane factor
MRHITLTGSILVLTVCSTAAQDAPIVLSLDAAVERGLAASPSLAETRAREAAAGAAVSARQALDRPIITASSGFLRTNHVEEFGVPQVGGGTRIIFPDIPSNVRARAEVALPVFTAGRTGKLVAAAESDRAAAGAETRRAAADLRLQITASYYELLFARARVDVLARALERADDSLDTVRARVDTGLAPPNESLSAEAQRARQNVQLIQARNDAARAEIDLARLAGVAPGRALVLSTPVDQPLPGAAETAATSVDELVARARADRPERQAIAAREMSRRAAADAALSATRPHVSVLAAVEPARPNPRFVPRADEWNTGWDLGVNATWTLWDGGRARAEHAGATAEADALGHRLADFDQMVAVEVRERLLDLATARAALAASADAVTAAAEARRVLGERFLVGVVANTEVLDADLAWLEAELDRTRLEATLRLSEARLLRTAGAR